LMFKCKGGGGIYKFKRLVANVLFVV
jgi:hypothetical protein